MLDELIFTTVEYHKLKDYLISTAKYSEAEAISTIKKIKGIDKQIRIMFIGWFKTGILPMESIENVTVSDIIKYRQTDEVKAFLILDWLKREPENAKAALMSTYDKIIPKNKPANTGLLDVHEDMSDIDVN